MTLNKQLALDAIEKEQNTILHVADEIWDYAELSLQEFRSAKLYCEVLKQEGFVKLDRRKGAVVALDVDKMRVLDEMRRDLSVVLARGICKNVTCDEVHQLVDELFMLFSRGQKEE